MLSARIVKARRDLQVDVALELQPGSALALFGASGSGKSTVLACIAGIEEPDDGYVKFDGLQLFPPSLPLHRRPLGYLTQEPIETLRQRLHLAPLWDAPAVRISGGQARRVSLARMLARRPPLVLLDEPFAGLDRQLVRELIDDLIFWSRDLGFRMIAVDHQSEVLQRLCPQRVIVLEAGRIVQQGAWDDLRRAPATPLLQSLLAPL